MGVLNKLLELLGIFFLKLFHALLPFDDEDELNEDEESLSLAEDDESFSSEDRDIFDLYFFNGVTFLMLKSMLLSIRMLNFKSIYLKNYSKN